jgi:hypothetical protein
LRANGTRKSWILRFLFCSKSLTEIRMFDFINAW